MSASIDLTPEQKQFLAHACAFIATHPSQDELDKLLTLAKMLLPEPAAEMLAQRAAAVAGAGADAPQPARWLQ